MSPHRFDPRNVDVLEMEERKAWQDPEEILGMVEVGPDFVVADLGCGSGFLSVPLARKARKVFGIDVQRKMLEFLEQKIQKLGLANIVPVLSSGSEVPLGRESVDLLVSVNTLHEFDEKSKMVTEIKRVLKPGAKALIADFKKEQTAFGPPVAIRVSKVEAANLFEEQGFTTLKNADFAYHYLLVFAK